MKLRTLINEYLETLSDDSERGHAEAWLNEFFEWVLQKPNSDCGSVSASAVELTGEFVDAVVMPYSQELNTTGVTIKLPSEYRSGT